MEQWIISFPVAFIAMGLNSLIYKNVNGKWPDESYGKKVLRNGLQMLSSIGAIIVLLLLGHVQVIVWILLVFYSLSFLWDFVISVLISQVLSLFLKNRNNTEAILNAMRGLDPTIMKRIERLTVISNLLTSVAELGVVFECMVLFGWIK